MPTDDDPTIRESARRPFDAPPVAPAVGATIWHQIASGGGVLAIECRACNRRSVLSKNECPAIRTGNRGYVLHATFRCRCGADHPRLFQAAREEATMFLAGESREGIVNRRALSAKAELCAHQGALDPHL